MKQKVTITSRRNLTRAHDTFVFPRKSKGFQTPNKNILGGNGCGYGYGDGCGYNYGYNYGSSSGNGGGDG